ncbi:MAG TPA: hypothetical protein VFZ21_25950 [Gemmatimonadaceae bacterium]|nr:hypothetical protein [Gemmatimonadaceae bacterium]
MPTLRATPDLAAQFLDHVASQNSGTVPEELASALAAPLLSDSHTRREIILVAWPQVSDELADAMRRHGYENWRQEQIDAEEHAE